MRDVRPILLLGSDDVIDCNDACGGFDMVSAFSQVERNEAAQEAFEFSWRELLERIAKPSLATELRQAELDFVVANVRTTWEALSPRPIAPRRKTSQTGLSSITTSSVGVTCWTASTQAVAWRVGL